MTAVYSCVRILSEAVAGLPLQFYRYAGEGGREKMEEDTDWVLRLTDGADTVFSFKTE